MTGFCMATGRSPVASLMLSCNGCCRRALWHTALLEGAACRVKRRYDAVTVHGLKKHESDRSRQM